MFIFQFGEYTFLKFQLWIFSSPCAKSTGPKGIPHICHLHHLQCRCQNFQAGVKKNPQIAVVVAVAPPPPPQHQHHHSSSTNTTAIKITTTTRPSPTPQNPFRNAMKCFGQYKIDLRCFVAKSVVSRFARFWCQIFELEMVLVSKNDKYEVWWTFTKLYDSLVGQFLHP